MAYIQDTYYLGDYIATEIKFIGRNGAKGERRAKKIKATPEQMAKNRRSSRLRSVIYDQKRRRSNIEQHSLS